MQHISQEDTHRHETIETRQSSLIASVVHFLAEVTRHCSSMQTRVDKYH